MSNQKMKGITCCGECGNYSRKEHRCMRGATNEMNAVNHFYDDCPLPDVSASAHKWIPCSERLPEIRKDCLVTVLYNGSLGRYGRWIKTGHIETDGDWWGDCMGGEVIAWMPLPEPYKGGDQNE